MLLAPFGGVPGLAGGFKVAVRLIPNYCNPGAGTSQPRRDGYGSSG